MRSLEEAMKYPEALRIVRERVKPERDKNRRKAYREYWWRFAEPRPGLRAKLVSLSRFIAGNAQGKRFLFVWCDATVCPSNLTNVFTFDDDYAMGLLMSSVHGAWARSESSTLRIDLRYTPTSCFETFPWPQPERAIRDEIGGISKSLIERRQAICAENEIGLTDLYNQVDDGAWQDIAALHGNLDAAVLRAYGWPASIATDPLELKTQLAERQKQIAGGSVPYAPFGVDE